MTSTVKHWSNVERLHETHRNPNIHIKGTHSYYSHAWSDSFEHSVVRYLYGDEYSLKTWEPAWEVDQLYIGDYVCIGAEAVILMGGNHTHRTDWFSLYPFAENITAAYQAKGDTVIGDGAIIASGAIVTKDVEPYTVVAGNPAKVVKTRFDAAVIERLVALRLYERPTAVFERVRPLLCANDIEALEQALDAL